MKLGNFTDEQSVIPTDAPGGIHLRRHLECPGGWGFESDKRGAAGTGT
jgi:hypothetical protein